MISFKKLILEGGQGGHLEHPFDFSSTGNELIDVFLDVAKSLEKTPGSVKIDGINASVRLVNNKFVIDRGSAKDLDIKGVRPEDLENRFGRGHGFIDTGKKVINIFDSTFPYTKIELSKLGLLQNPNILLNVEFVENKSNVLEYGNIGNFLAIHGLKEIKPKNIVNGVVKSRYSVEIPYNLSVMKSYIDKLNKISSKHGFKILGNIDTKLKSKPNLTRILRQRLTLYPDGMPVTRSLNDWLKDVRIVTPLITRKEFKSALSSKNITTSFPHKDTRKIVNDVVVYISTMKLGQEILNNYTSEIGDLSGHEGIVIRDPSIHNKVFKITGNFILQGMDSQFQK